MPEERLQKILAHAGYGSRRACEGIIEKGRVTVNGQKVSLGDKADKNRDDIRVDGKRIQAAEKKIYIALHKPRGVVSTTDDEEGRQTILDLVPNKGRLYPVGRLDYMSEGLILLTNDGELTNRLTHPRYGHKKIYRVLVARHPTDEELDTWRKGVDLEDGYTTQPAEVELETYYGKGAWLRITMSEGRKRQIREIADKFGLPIVNLIRVQIASLKLGNLKNGEWRELAEKEVALLQGKKPTKGKRSTKKPRRGRRR
ncbi:MAG: rRNA pseudouridine synthase [Chloroflexi bacterium]|nr:MAG: rRNA pseudouridine synthase [Chloroflexota bacterium]MBL1193516.1 rRNA pseudouridine synthase [Chloroflexota bacterium]NOH10807.1 rRNA pseudouridine synthase [Chloroflexota bacterium]